MEWMTRSDAVLLAFAAYVAVMSLVRLMQRRRDQVVADVQRQVEEHRKRARRAAADDATRSAA